MVCPLTHHWSVNVESPFLCALVCVLLEVLIFTKIAAVGRDWISYHTGNTICFNTTCCTTAESRLIYCREAKQSNCSCGAPLRSLRVRYWIVCVCLFSSVEGFGLEAEARMTTWHVMMPTENEADATHSHDVSEGEILLRVFCVCRWMDTKPINLADCLHVCGLTLVVMKTKYPLVRDRFWHIWFKITINLYLMTDN